MAALFKWLVFLAGLGVVAWIAAETDLAAVAADMARLGWGGGAALALVFVVGFGADVIAWATMFASIPLDARSTGRLFLVQMAGEAVNTLMPFGSLGGEPVKAMLLKRRYAVGYRESAAALVLAQAVNTLAEVPFIAVGLIALAGRNILPAWAEIAMIGGGAWLAVFIAGVFVALHMRLLVSLERRLARSRWGESLARGLAALREVEERLFTFVRRQPRRFVAATGLSFLTWLSGAAEMWIVLHALGAQVDWQDAWLVEAGVVLVRNVTFFVPAHMGSQDAVMVVMIEALTGSPELGLAVALIRRGRELVFSTLGMAVGGWLGFRPGAVPAP